MKLPLFEKEDAPNLLPYDGEMFYFENVLPMDEAQGYFERLMTGIEWENDEAIMFGKHIITKRKVAWYADRHYSYAYSNITKSSLPWTNALLDLKRTIEQLQQGCFNSCLLNLYHNGNEGMAWHSDDEKALGKTTTIASLSLGAVRKFALKHKQTKEKITLNLTPGSVLFMKGSTQQHWLHRLPPTKKVAHARINLTFRQMLH
jgi:alkylated DNA repair dioxygenase AlkB